MLNPSLLSQYMCGVLILALHPSKRFFKSASTSFALSRIELNLSFQYFFVNFGAHSVFHHSLILFPQNENTFLISSHFSEAPVFIFSQVSPALLAISSPHTCQFFLISPVIFSSSFHNRIDLRFCILRFLLLLLIIFIGRGNQLLICFTA